MTWIALRMLMGDRAKYFGLIFGVSFATLLMTQQVSIFMGIMKRTANQILDVRDAEIWVMDSKVRFIDEVPALPDTDLYRVRGVSGVEWAVRMYKGQVRARMADGNFRNVVLFVLDDDTLVGAPQTMLVGDLSDICKPDAVIVDKAVYEYMWPGEPYKIGREFELNDRRAVLVGVCKASAPFTTMPILYTRYSSASGYVPRERNMMTFVLAHPEDGVSEAEVSERIEAQRGLTIWAQIELFWITCCSSACWSWIILYFSMTRGFACIVGNTITSAWRYLFTMYS